MPEVKFTCPKCGNVHFEEIQVDVTVSSECILVEHPQVDPGYELVYGLPINDGGHVDRFQCSGCGFKIIDHDSPHCNMGLGAMALGKALKELGGNDPVSHRELVQRLAATYEELSGKDMVEAWNSIFPEQEIVYDDDSIYHFKADEPPTGVGDCQD